MGQALIEFVIILPLLLLLVLGTIQIALLARATLLADSAAIAAAQAAAREFSTGRAAMIDRAHTIAAAMFRDALCERRRFKDAVRCGVLPRDDRLTVKLTLSPSGDHLTIDLDVGYPLCVPLVSMLFRSPEDQAPEGCYSATLHAIASWPISEAETTNAEVTHGNP